MDVSPKGKADLWRERIESQRDSGQSVRTWCAANGVREQSFYWWRRRLAPVQAPAAPAEATFARVVLPDDKLFRQEPLRLRLRGERELMLPATMPMADIAALIVSLERQA